MNQSKRLEKWYQAPGFEIMSTKKIAVHDDDKSPDGPKPQDGRFSF